LALTCSFHDVGATDAEGNERKPLRIRQAQQ
jgi:hypothetical protein